MNNTVFFIDTQYSNHLVASRTIKQFALDGITNITTSCNIFVKSNLIGLTDEIIDEFIHKKAKQSILVGVLEREACIIAVDANLLDIFFPNIQSLYNNIRKEWLHYDLGSYQLKLLNSTSKIISFNQEIQHQLREKAINQGVFLQDTSTTYLSFDTTFGKGVLIEPNVYFSSKVKVGDNVHIKAFSYLEGVEIESGAVIGPFARIRGSSKIGSNVRIGNFVEIKNSIIHTNSKVLHLAYIGDAKIGKNVNIGAGVVTCNYDGFAKHNTIIKDDTFIGSNSSLIAPLTIGISSFIGAGSFINKDVPDKTFASGRSSQCMKPNRRT